MLKLPLSHAEATASALQIYPADDKFMLGVYDPINDKWENTKNMPFPRGYQSSAVVNNRIYLIGGEKAFSHVEHYDTVWEYNPFDQPTTSVSPKESLIGTWGKIRAGN
jgi:N-acetylneuraminic acid mutarotase